MLGEEQDHGWPWCGEVDIMENFGTYSNVNDASINNGTAHGPTTPLGSGNYNDYSTGEAVHAAAGRNRLRRLSRLRHSVVAGFGGVLCRWRSLLHGYAVDGSAGRVGFQQRTNFYILLNLAIGGPSTFLGTPDPNCAVPEPGHAGGLRARLSAGRRKRRGAGHHARRGG